MPRPSANLLGLGDALELSLVRPEGLAPPFAGRSRLAAALPRRRSRGRLSAAGPSGHGRKSHQARAGKRVARVREGRLAPDSRREPCFDSYTFSWRPGRLTARLGTSARDLPPGSASAPLVSHSPRNLPLRSPGSRRRAPPAHRDPRRSRGTRASAPHRSAASGRRTRRTQG